jgi:dihydroxyacetone kinase-like predicted kinase
VAVSSGPDLDAVLREVVDRVLARGQSFLTILTGEEAPALDGLVAALEARHSDLEVEIHEGGQPHYPLLLVAQ